MPCGAGAKFKRLFHPSVLHPITSGEEDLAVNPVQFDVFCEDEREHEVRKVVHLSLHIFLSFPLSLCLRMCVCVLVNAQYEGDGDGDGGDEGRITLVVRTVLNDNVFRVHSLRTKVQ
jgi:hypothetical protein